MNTPFNLIQAFTSWFFRKDADVVLQSGKKIAVDSANIEISNGNLTITTGNITITGTVDGVDISSHAADSDAHHNQQHAINGSDHTGTLDDSQIPSSIARDSEVTSAISSHASDGDAHHNESHTIASHSDTSATGSELNTLTDGSNADSLHDHSNVGSHTIASHSDTSATGAELNTLTDGSEASTLHLHDFDYYQRSSYTHNPGAASAPLFTNSNGYLIIRGLGIGSGAATTADDLDVVGDVNIDGNMTSGQANVVGIVVKAGGVVTLEERATPSTPASGKVKFWANTSGDLYWRDSSGTIHQVAEV